MPKMTETELKALLEAEKRDALSAQQASKLSVQREKSMRYYNGDMSLEMPTIDGRSKAVSTDVADTVEGLMPQFMKIFCGGDEVVKFEPVGPEDVAAAAQETDFVNHVFMHKNNGTMLLYEGMKNALLQKTGAWKVWTETEERENKETYLDQPEDAFMMLVSNPDIEVIEHTEHDGLHDVTIVERKKVKKHKVASLLPEEFGVSRYARSIRDAGYCFHETPRQVGELIAEGYDADQLKGIASFINAHNIEQLARDTVDEHMWAGGGSALNEANRMILVTEHYIRCDYNKNNKAVLMRVTTAGEKSEILTRDGEPDCVEVPHVPIAAITPYPTPGRFFGRSVADLVMDIQEIKTALLRGLLDNTYMAVNPRAEVAEVLSTETTLDDLLTMRPGMPIRVKQPGAIAWQQMPFIGGEVLPVIQFMDTTREWKTGVSRQGQGIDPNSLQNQVATIANQMENASQMKVELIARIFAETGIRDLFALLHAEIREHGDQEQIVRLRNQWVTVDPRDWKERDDMTINVGLGMGNTAQQMAATQLVIQAQEKAIQAGMVSPKNLYASARDLVRLAGKKDPESYFTEPGRQLDPQDPASHPIQPPPDPKVQQMQLQYQLDMQADQRKAQIEGVQAQADIQTQRDKTQAEMVQTERDYQLKRELAILQFQLEERLKMAEEARKEREHQQKLDHAREMHMHSLAQTQASMIHSQQAHEQKMETRPE